MPRYAMVIDLDKCNGCYNCFLACRDEHYGNDYPPYSAAQPLRGHFWLRVIEKERGQYPRVKVAYIPKLCMHCDNPPCQQAAVDGAVYKRPDGIVIIDPEKSLEQRQIVDACPHRVIFWNEEKKIPQKCTFCAHLLDKGWQEPRCVEACPTGALVFGDADDPGSKVSKVLHSARAEELRPEYGLKSRVKYIGLPRLFIAGTVIFGDTDECAGGVTVVLRGEGVELSTKTNNFGDFEFEGLAPGSYEVLMQHTQYQSRSINVIVKTDLYLGENVLERMA
ncbi:4Fe-4S dicluster domain-containing protein [Moorella sulfitireducens]|uniref:4Fe-4S dicluster domain-containing protein n=1 Tax=Neomoorella sulfitireducens TaxID=2972948 RepID=UPI0021ACAB74|nr:4Fe-4S dicluster domain-containing protein [Moorella sulfitireducens]